MRQTGIFGIDIPQLSDKPDITVVSDAIDSVEKNSGGRIEHLKASFSGNNITLNSTVRDKQYAKYYEGLTVMFESPMTLNTSGTYTVSIYNLPQQPLKLKTRVVKGDVVMATWTEQDGFKVANIAGGGGSTSKISVTQNDHGFNFTAVTYDIQLAKYVPTDISKGIQCEGIAVNIDKNTFDLYMEGFIDVDVDVRDDKGEGFASDEYYFASETVAGKMQKEKPTTIIQTLVYAIRLDNSLKFYINIGQPFDIVQSYITQDNMESFGIASIARVEKIGIELDKKQNSSDSGLKTNAKTIVGAINENYEKFKNFCPFPINSLFLTLGTENPATLFLGTTWQKQEGRFLLGSSSTYAIGSTGGNSTITLTEANIPRHRHQVDTVSATIPEHTHNLNITRTNEDGYQNGQYVANGTSNEGNMIWTTSSAGGGSTGAIAPYTSYVGSGTTFNNMPPYLVINIWKRLS